MATNYLFRLTSQLLDGADVNRVNNKRADGTYTQAIWQEVTIAAGASDTVVSLGLLTDPKVLVVIGGDDVSFKLDSTGTDAIGADPFAVICDEADGLGIDSVLVSNAGAAAVVVTVICVE